MLLASVDSFGYRLLFLLHVLSFVVALAPAFVWPVVNRVARTAAVAEGVEGPGPSVGGLLGHVFSPVVHGGAIVVSGLCGFGLIGLSDKAWKFSQTWVSIGMLLWFLMVALVLAGLVPAQRAVREGRTAAEQRVAMLYGGLHLLLLLQLIDMIWKPGL